MRTKNIHLPITFDDVKSANKRINQYLLPTPLRSYKSLDEVMGMHVLVKHENHNPTNSFKVRNALSVLTALSFEERKVGIVAATRGNHGQGLAWAGKLLSVPVTICVPIGNNPEKNEAMRGFGAEIIEEGIDYDEAVLVMNRLVRERRLRMVHSTNDPLVISGAATLTMEILDQAREMNEKIDAMVFAIGGGSQAVGAMTVLMEVQPDVEVFGVQAERASAIHDSWRAGHPVILSHTDTFADGIATRRTYEMTFDAIKNGVCDFALVSESELAESVRLMISTTHNLAEGAGAAGLAGLKKLAGKLQGKTVVIVLSGSNIDQLTLKKIFKNGAFE